MDKQIRKITIIATCAVIFFGIIAVPRLATADEIFVDGNGSNSTNSVSLNLVAQTNTLQTNTTTATGGNSVSNSTGISSTVKTGNAIAATNVSTTANTSTVNADCGCSQGSTVALTNNGTGSNNAAINVSSSDTSTLVSNQQATGLNDISQYVNIGYNSEKDNKRNILTQTGSVDAEVNSTANPINVSQVSSPSETDSSPELKKSANVTKPLNSSETNEAYTTPGTVVNSSSTIDAADTNSDAVDTGTGSTYTYDDNDSNNLFSTASACACEKVHTKPTVPRAPTPPANNSVPVSSSSSPSTSGFFGSGFSSGPGLILVAAASSLHVTSSYWFFIALIGNILVMLLGGYLRLHSGRSPGFVFAV